jgi:hypothetical protein
MHLSLDFFFVLIIFRSLFLKKNQARHCLLCKDSTTKESLESRDKGVLHLKNHFQLFFYSKIDKKKHKNLNKLIYAFKKLEKRFKNKKLT